MPEWYANPDPRYQPAMRLISVITQADPVVDYNFLSKRAILNNERICMKIIKNCKICAREFSYYSGENHCGKYCSRNCSIKGSSFWKTSTKKEKKDRLTKLFNKRVIRKDGCWGWRGGCNKNGYPAINTSKFGFGTPTINRASWLIHYGEIPKDMYVCHTCDNRRCSNPEHLFLGTHKDNMRDMTYKGRKKGVCGEQHHLSKLTNDEVKAIKRMLSHNNSTGAIARLYNVPTDYIYKIKTKRSWGWLREEE